MLSLLAHLIMPLVCAHAAPPCLVQTTRHRPPATTPPPPPSAPRAHFESHSLSAQQSPKPVVVAPGASPDHDVAWEPPASASSLDHT